MNGDSTAEDKLNTSGSGQESILGLGTDCDVDVVGDNQSNHSDKYHSPTRRSNEMSSSNLNHPYSWRPPTPPPGLMGTRDNSVHGRSASDISSKSEGKRWLSSLFPHNNHTEKNLEEVDERNSTQSPDSVSATSILSHHSLLLKEESDASTVHEHTASKHKNDSSSPLKFRKPQKRRIKTTSTLSKTMNVFSLLKHDDDPQNDMHENDDAASTYQMMKSRHGQSSQSASETLEASDASFFYKGIEELEAQRHSRNTNSNSINRNRHHGYFNHQSRREFIQAHGLLNADMGPYHDDDESEEEDGFDYDFTTLFTFGCSPAARAKHSKREQDALPAIADITKSSLSYISNGRIQMKLPGDNVRLVMDEFLEPGILSVEKDDTVCHELDDVDDLSRPFLSSVETNQDQERPIERKLLNEIADVESNNHIDGDQRLSRRNHRETKLPDLRYVLTVDQNLYKSIIKEVPASKMPCGLYFCFHDAVDGSRHVNISVAIIILSIVFILLFVGTCIWPTD